MVEKLFESHAQNKTDNIAYFFLKRRKKRITKPLNDWQNNGPYMKESS